MFHLKILCIVFIFPAIVNGKKGYNNFTLDCSENIAVFEIYSDKLIGIPWGFAIQSIDPYCDQRIPFDSKKWDDPKCTTIQHDLNLEFQNGEFISQCSYWGCKTKGEFIHIGINSFMIKFIPKEGVVAYGGRGPLKLSQNLWFDMKQTKIPFRYHADSTRYNIRYVS